MKRSNILVLKYVVLFLIVFVGFILAPFIFNDFSFSYFKSLVFWGGISPLIFSLPTIVFCLFENEE